MLKVILIPELQNNYSFIGVNERTKQAFIIDPATSKDVLHYCDTNGLKITYILNTHHHKDHTGGNEAIKRESDCLVIAGHYDASKIPEVDLVVTGQKDFIINDFKLKIIDLPGHTLGHVGFYFFEQNILFCGDVLFSGGCGRVFEGTPNMMFDSLKKIIALPKETLIYCAHEYTLNNLEFAINIDSENQKLKDYYKKVITIRDKNISTIPTNLELELQINPFLRVEKLKCFTTNNHYKNWAELRRLKDNF